MSNVPGTIIKDGANYNFFSKKGKKYLEPIGYVKYGANTDVNVDVGFIDYYPVTIYLLNKLSEEETTCDLECEKVKNRNVPRLHDGKMIIII